VTRVQVLRLLEEIAGIRPVLVRHNGPHQVYMLGRQRFQLSHGPGRFERPAVESVCRQLGLPSPWHA
jgi:hypothetical protein